MVQLVDVGIVVVVQSSHGGMYTVRSLAKVNETSYYYLISLYLVGHIVLEHFQSFSEPSENIEG